MQHRVLNGLKAIIPLALTITIVVWLFNALEQLFGTIVKLFIPHQYYFYGMGAIVGIIVIFFLGLLMNAWLAKKIYAIGEKIVHKLPLVGSLYRAIHDLMGFFGSDPEKKKGQVVTLMVGGMRVFGMMTREEFADLPSGVTKVGEVAVYIPMTYNIGGFTIFVPRSEVTPVDMSFESMMTWVMTGGMKRRGNQLDN